MRFFLSVRTAIRPVASAVIGADYRDLKAALASSCLIGALACTIEFLLCLIVAQAVLAALLPLATVRGVLAFGLGSGIAGAALQAGIAVLGRRREAATA